jgi:hypothetical protein
MVAAAFMAVASAAAGMAATGEVAGAAAVGAGLDGAVVGVIDALAGAGGVAVGIAVGAGAVEVGAGIRAGRSRPCPSGSRLRRSPPMTVDPVAGSGGASGPRTATIWAGGW